MSLYETLGVSATATPEEIKAGGRAKQKATHPDAGGDTAAFQEVQTALRVLSDPDKRAHYDRTGQADTSNRSPEEQEAGEAMSMLAQLLNELMAGDPRYTDIPKSITQRADREISGMKSRMTGIEAQAQAQLKKADDFLKRLKRKGDTDPTLETIIQGQRGQAELALQTAREQHAKAIRLWERMKALVNGYEYVVEKQPDPYAGRGVDNWNQMRGLMDQLDRELGLPPRKRPDIRW